MKVALIGYGKMGHEIEKILISRNHEVVSRVTKETPEEYEKIGMADVAIEFTAPDAAIGNIRKCLDAGLPVVTGTTGWYNALEEVIAEVNKKNGSMIHASNFSLGVNIFFELNKHLSRIMTKFPEYKVAMEEIHHTQKLDSPSGTALTLVKGILATNSRYSKWEETEEEVEDDVISIHSKREGTVPGTHIIRYHSEADQIEIQHKAHSRSGFAMGAVLAAEWLIGRKGVYTMNDVLSL